MRQLLTLSCAFLLAASLAATEVSTPTNLGAASLTPSVRIWKWTEALGWASASAAGVTVEELGSGDYYLAGLPTATDATRYLAVVYDSGTPAEALAVYGWGASPGQRIVWRHLVDLGDTPLVFKQHDTHGDITLDVTSGLVEDIGDPSTTVAFALWSPTTGAVVFSGRAGSIENVALDSTSGTYSATLVYDLQDGDLDTAGTFLGEFTVTFPDATTLTLPSNNTLRLTVREDFDGS